MTFLATLTARFESTSFPKSGQDIVRGAIKNAPVREVKSSGSNVITYLASRKMGFEIATESRTVEYPAAVGYEHDREVLGYYPQPCKLQLVLVEEDSGEIHSFDHTPDFLVITETDFYLDEWKSPGKLKSLEQKSPWRYRKIAGQWRSPLIEKELAARGIVYRLRCSDEISQDRTENLLALRDYFEAEAPPCSPHVIEHVTNLLRDFGSLSLGDLQGLPYGFAADDLLKGIADRHFVCSLDAALVSNIHDFRLYRDDTLRDFELESMGAASQAEQASYVLDLTPGSEFIYENKTFQIALVDEKLVHCTDLQTKTTTQLAIGWFERALQENKIRASGPLQISCNLADYSERDLSVAKKRHLLLSQDLPAGASAVSERTLYRWAAQQFQASANGGHEILSLVPRHSAKGNRKCRLSQGQLDCMQSTFKQIYQTSAAPNVKACYRHLQSLCIDMAIPAPSYPSFIQFVKVYSNDAITRSRMGKRYTYQQAGFYHTLDYTTPIHGTRPFQCVHIDHTVLDIELKSRRTGKSLGRPWLTLVIDAFSRRVLHIFISFDAPSRATVFMAVRALVKRWGRLPEMVMTDNGKDLISIDIRSFFSSLGVDSRYRPAGQPRYGAFMERFFGTLNTQLLHNLNGNTKILRNVRQATQSHLPKNLADWNLENLYSVIEAWLETDYDLHQHPALGMSPKEAFDKAQRETGTRPHKLIAFNQDFLIATCPSADRQGRRTVDGQRGVKVNNFYYFTPELRDPEIIGRSVQVRVDPTDAATVFVQVRGKWLSARCAQLRHLPRMNLRQLEAVTAEYKKRYPISGQAEHNSQRLQEYISTFKPHPSDEQDWQAQFESTSLQQKLGLIGPRASESAFVSTPMVQPDMLHEPTGNTVAEPDVDADAIWTNLDSLPDFEDM